MIRLLSLCWYLLYRWRLDRVIVYLGRFLSRLYFITIWYSIRRWWNGGTRFIWGWWGGSICGRGGRLVIHFGWGWDRLGLGWIDLEWCRRIWFCRSLGRGFLWGFFCWRLAIWGRWGVGWGFIVRWVRGCCFILVRRGWFGRVSGWWIASRCFWRIMSIWWDRRVRFCICLWAIWFIMSLGRCREITWLLLILRWICRWCSILFLVYRNLKKRLSF
jgi:hypothetical protein